MLGMMTSPTNKTNRKVTTKLKPVIEFQTMDTSITMETAYEEGDVILNSPAARQAAADRRHGLDPPDLSRDFPGPSSGQQQGQQPPAVGGQVQGNANGLPQGASAPITNPGSVDNRTSANYATAAMKQK